MTEEKRLALLIDSDNVSAKYAQYILQEAAKYGELTYKRIYGDWEKGGNGWHYPALNNSILPVQQTSYIAGKNATDFSMIIDAMDILYTGDVDGFVLVTSDSDFTRLAIRLREAGMIVVGIGEVKTPIPFTASCHHFSYLNQACENISSYDEKTLRKEVLDFVAENDDGRLDLAKISAYLTSKYGTIDFDSIGFSRFSNFIDSFPELRRSNTFVTRKKKTGGSKSNGSEPAPAEISAVIVEYLKRKNGSREDLSQLEKYVTGVFGKVDYSRFGSKRFARFVDNQPEFVRRNTVVLLAQSAEPETKPAVKITPEDFAEDVKKYASENMPSGGNLGQLNNVLMEKYGKNYVKDLGFDDFAKAVLSVTAVKVEKNNVFSEPEKPKKEKPEKTEKQAKTKKQKPEKPDLNALKREIQISAAQSEKGVPAAELEKSLKEKFGEDIFRAVGVSSLKKLIPEIAGVSLSRNLVKMSKDFIERTEQIEQFARDFVSGGKKRGVKSLSSQIRKNFEGFDHSDYGYAKFSDFINAIDGVKADRYYVEEEKD